MINTLKFNNIGPQHGGVNNASMSSPSLSPSSPALQNYGTATATASSHRPSGNITVYPTTGPDAYTSPILAPGGSGTPASNPRSCVTCRRRKVRCDKQMPCSNCRRTQVPCVFPAPGRAPRQFRPRDPNAPPKMSSQRDVELFKRLRKLEDIVEELSGQIDEPAATGASLPSSAGSPDHTPGNESLSQRRMSGNLDERIRQDFSPRRTESSAGGSSDSARANKKQLNFGRMVSDEERGTSHYVSSGFWTKLNDELDAIREETQRLTDENDELDFDGTPSDSTATALSSISDHHAFILGYRSADVDLQKLHPLPSQSTFLWSAYRENVEPIIKVMHVPSVDLILRDARRNFDELSPGNKALVFAIYFAAITSLESDEVQTNFNANIDDLVAQYRFAVEQALAKANFLDSSDLVVLQAFTIFLVVVRRYDDGRFCWALTGLVIRIAQGMGLHRDGSYLKLSPFETEMRRRLWWAILALDMRSVDDLSTDMTISDDSFDTLKPSNINDSDIGPERTEAPVPREGKSDCAVALVRYEICVLARRLFTTASAMSSLCPSADHSSMAERERMLIDVYQRMEHKFLRHVLHETDPLYWVAAMIARIVVGKMYLVIYQPALFPGSDVELSDEIRQRIYVSAIEVIEYSHKLHIDPRCKQYRWLSKTYTNWHAIAYILIETGRRPWTALVERGWDAVSGYDIDPLELAEKAVHAAVFLPLRKLFTKARKHSESELARLRSNQDEVRRLDFAERMTPAQAHFGPVPGAENRMDLMREKWWSLVRPREATSSPLSAHHSITSLDRSSTSQTGGDTLRSSSGTIPTQVNLSSAAMEYMDEIMAQPNPFMDDLLHLNDLNDGSVTAISPAPASQMAPQNLLGSQDTLRRHSLDLLQAQNSKNDDLPPYLWSDRFTSKNFEPSEDADMHGVNFNWQDWSQNLKGLQMGNLQTQQRWYY
ncbi:hypothetical protein C2857_007678 [Epichloe festucae Fl1]|uniref:Zn(2)-C6 fungal-type domain-containing protein n=1 Tax=Epichloe festucae (strain Fl1) TaxID=877507 RepID=A0A7S9PSZ8_EPIFF|nr:hypothetical protein C2857_007678 [Epichloe festucae Fl1]